MLINPFKLKMFDSSTTVDAEWAYKHGYITKDEYKKYKGRQIMINTKVDAVEKYIKPGTKKLSNWNKEHKFGTKGEGFVQDMTTLTSMTPGSIQNTVGFGYNSAKYLFNKGKKMKWFNTVYKLVKKSFRSKPKTYTQAIARVNKDITKSNVSQIKKNKLFWNLDDAIREANSKKNLKKINNPSIIDKIKKNTKKVKNKISTFKEEHPKTSKVIKYGTIPTVGVGVGIYQTNKVKQALNELDNKGKGLTGKDVTNYANNVIKGIETLPTLVNKGTSYINNIFKPKKDLNNKGKKVVNNNNTNNSNNSNTSNSRGHTSNNNQTINKTKQTVNQYPGMLSEEQVKKDLSQWDMNKLGSWVQKNAGEDMKITRWAKKLEGLSPEEKFVIESSLAKKLGVPVLVPKGKGLDALSLAKLLYRYKKDRAGLQKEYRERYTKLANEYVKKMQPGRNIKDFNVNSTMVNINAMRAMGYDLNDISKARRSMVLGSKLNKGDLSGTTIEGNENEFISRYKKGLKSLRKKFRV